MSAGTKKSSLGLARVTVTVASPTSVCGRHPYVQGKINTFVGLHTQQPQPRKPHLCLWAAKKSSSGTVRVTVTVASPTSVCGQHPYFLAKINRFFGLHTQQPQPRKPHRCLWAPKKSSLGIVRVTVTVASPTSVCGRRSYLLAFRDTLVFNHQKPLHQLAQSKLVG